MSITEFLLARIAEDEAVAREASIDGGAWTTSYHENDGSAVSVVGAERVVVYDEGDPLPSQADHIARHDPARVLAECEAKRRIVEAFEEERVRRDIYNRDYDSGQFDFTNNDLRARLASNAHCRGLEIGLLALASVYVDHPDYDDKWSINTQDA